MTFLKLNVLQTLIFRFYSTNIDFNTNRYNLDKLNLLFFHESQKLLLSCFTLWEFISNSGRIKILGRLQHYTSSQFSRQENRDPDLELTKMPEMYCEKILGEHIFGRLETNWKALLLYSLVFQKVQINFLLNYPTKCFLYATKLSNNLYSY